MADAIFDITDNGFSISAAYAKHGIPKETLRKRYNGIAAAEEQIQPAQRLSNSQERRIVEWIIRQESLGYAPAASVVRAIVISVLEKMGDIRPLGKKWMHSFKSRHPLIITKMGKKQEAARFKSFTPKAVN